MGRASVGNREGGGGSGREWEGGGEELTVQCSWFTVHDSQFTDHNS